MACTGYRDTQQLRIRNESQDVRKKALLRKATYSEPRSLALSLELQARHVFFTYYVTGFSKTWDFLKPFYIPTHSPEHLKLSIDAVSLAYLSHQAYSDVALSTAREKYVSALHMTNKALQSPEVAVKDSTLLASLLLDLFEKFTNDKSRHSESWKSHVKGALALVRLRDLEQFQDPSALRLLVRLSTNFLISSVATDTRVPDGVSALRAYAGERLNAGDPKWRLTNLMVHYANLRSHIWNSHLSSDDGIRMSMDLHAKLQALAFNVPASWQYKTTAVNHDSEMIYNHRFDSYADRHVTQTWNVSRLVRILLNEYVLECYLEPAADITANGCSLLMSTASYNIETLACEICASVPQYVDCLGAARSKLPVSEPAITAFDGAGHLHSPSQKLDCYTLIFPLYVAGRSRGSPSTLKPWIIKQLRHIGSHFGIRNAELICQILEKGADVNPWAVYAMLGSYAFAA